MAKVIVVTPHKFYFIHHKNYERWEDGELRFEDDEGNEQFPSVKGAGLDGFNVVMIPVESPQQ